MITRAFIVELFLLFCALSWVSASAWVIWTGNGEFFQRLGSWGVAVSILNFLLVRTRTPVPPDFVARLTAFQRRQLDNSQYLGGAFRNIALTGFELHQTRMQLGLDPLPFSSGTEETLKSDLSREPMDYSALQTSLDNLEADELHAVTEFGRLSRLREIYQNAMAVIATLQWGFGDLLFARPIAECC